MSASEVDVEEASFNGLERELLQGTAARLALDEPAVDRAAARLVVQRFAKHERRRKQLWVAGSALSLAAVVALGFGLGRQAGSARSPALLAAARSSSLVVESGSVRLADGSSVASGQPVAAETLAVLGPATCLRAGSQVRLCSKPGAKLKLPALGSAFRVELESGALTADLGSTPSGFTLSTLHGNATVVGTLFSMEVDSSRSFTTVLVSRGSVLVHNQSSGEEATLMAGAEARLGQQLVLAAKQAMADAPSSTPPDAPAQTPPAGAEHHGSAPSSASAATGKSASELLEEARQARGAGRYAEAAQVYRKLGQQHPASAEARAALVSLGQLELGQLGRPEAALRSFQAYLAGPGQLRQEAEHGLIQALQKLGRKADERRAIEGFLARYPKSTQAGTLKQRLQQL